VRDCLQIQMTVKMWQCFVQKVCPQIFYEFEKKESMTEYCPFFLGVLQRYKKLTQKTHADLSSIIWSHIIEESLLRY
jgi:hypothetical protein